jgi:hypothetical protein
MKDDRGKLDLTKQIEVLKAEVNGHLEEVKRIEVQESNIIGQNSIRVVLKPTRSKLIIAPKTPD